MEPSTYSSRNRQLNLDENDSPRVVRVCGDVCSAPRSLKPKPIITIHLPARLLLASAPSRRPRRPTTTGAACSGDSLGRRILLRSIKRRWHLKRTNPLLQLRFKLRPHNQSLRKLRRARRLFRFPILRKRPHLPYARRGDRRSRAGLQRRSVWLPGLAQCHPGLLRLARGRP